MSANEVIAPGEPSPEESALGTSQINARLAGLEAEVKSLRGKGVALAVIAALLGSGGATAIATTYLSSRTLVIQERLAKNDETQKDIQNRQIAADTELKKQTLATEKLKADQASFEARMAAYSTALTRLGAEKQDAIKAGDKARAAEIEAEWKRQVEGFRVFIEVQKRFVQENPNVPGWYRFGVEQAQSLAAKR